MKIRLILIIMFISFSMNIFGKEIKGVKINDDYIPYTLIDSITFSKSGNIFIQNIHISEHIISSQIENTYSVNHYEILDTPGWYELTNYTDNEINATLVSDYGLCIVIYNNNKGGETGCIFNLNNINSDSAIYIDFDEENNIQQIISDMYISDIEIDEFGNQTLVTYDNEGLYTDVVLPKYEKSPIFNIQSRSSNCYQTKINNINQIINYISNERPSESSVWDIMGDLGSSLLSNMIPGIGGKILGVLISGSLDELKRQKQKYHDKLLNLLYGNCSINIKAVWNEGYHYYARLVVSNSQSLPKNRYSNQTKGIYYGLVGKINSLPDIKDNTFLKGHYFTSTDLEKDIDLGELKIETKYVLRPYILSYDQVKYNLISECVRYGGELEFVTPTPSVSTIEIVEGSITENSATVRCSFSNISNGVTCGVEAVSDKNTSITLTSSNDGVHDLQLSELKSATEYTCYAFVEYNGKRKVGNAISFVTKLPDISGTWTCVEKHYKNNNIDLPYDVTYTITLKEDGSVTCSNHDNLVSSGWSYSPSGKVTISLMTLDTQNACGGIDYTGYVNDIANPTTIKGSNHNWYFNSVVGYVGGDGYSFTMSR